MGRVAQNSRAPAMLKGNVPADSPEGYTSDGSKEDDGFKVVDHDFGSVSEIKQLLARYNERGDIKIVENTAEDVENAEEHNRFAITSTRIYDKNGHFWNTRTEIRSHHLKRMLKEIIGRYPGLSLSDSVINFVGKPQPLFFYLDEIAKYRETADEEAQVHIDLLLKQANYLMGKDIAHFRELFAQGRINFSLAWMLFKPGSLAYTRTADKDQVTMIGSTALSCANGQRWWSINNAGVDYDGNRYGRASSSSSVTEFAGDVKITSLEIYPLELHQELETLKERLIMRGRRWLSLAGIHQMEYQGQANCIQPSWSHSPGPDGMEEISGRIMIDRALYCTEVNYNAGMNDYARPAQCPCTGCKQFEAVFRSLLCHCEICSTEGAIIEKHKFHPIVLSDEDLMMCSPHVYGFSFRQKLWCQFNIDKVEPLNLNTAAFDQLSISPAHKEMVYAMVKSQVSPTHNFDDIISGKGKSLILLLHGPPGVGKTLTAESVADKTGAPLWSVSSGELGIDMTAIERTIDKIFQIATHWKAIVLLDEADVFLQERNGVDVARNALVSVFLRLLEYFKGILFLTTNRVSSFDPAFKSRIHIALQYPELSAQTRRSIWGTFLDNIPAEHKLIAESDLDELEEQQINGRQIKNACKTALSLALEKGEKLELRHLRTTVNTIKDFEVHFSRQS